MINFLKKHWAVVLLVLVLLNSLKNNFLGNVYNLSTPQSYNESYGIAMDAVGTAPKLANLSAPSISLPGRQAAPSDSPDRLVITDTSLSLQVKDVSQSINTIQQETQKLGGFLVNSHLSKPEMAASGNITIRIPSDKLPQALEVFRSLAVKVVSESVVGTDVTDQYEDLDARLAVLYKTKAKFESIMDQAVKVTDLLEVQRELISLQSQIDSLIGQQEYYKKSADLSKVVIYLSTDDLSLPYAPTGQWRPLVVFKTAVRSLLQTLRGFGNLIIWLAVYSVIAIPLYLLFKFIKKKIQAKQI